MRSLGTRLLNPPFPSSLPPPYSPLLLLTSSPFFFLLLLSSSSLSSLLLLFYTQEFLPPYASSAEESSEGEYPPESGYEDQWELGDLPPLGELDMSDLWVTDDTIPLTETKRRSRKFSLSKQRRHSATKDQQPQRHSSLLHRLSFSRRREEDRLRLVEEEEEPVGEPDVLSEKEMENFKVKSLSDVCCATIDLSSRSSGPLCP